LSKRRPFGPTQVKVFGKFGVKSEAACRAKQKGNFGGCTLIFGTFGLCIPLPFLGLLALHSFLVLVIGWISALLGGFAGKIAWSRICHFLHFRFGIFEF
jgi:hypothetical protein